jgi:hypothetical protein
MSEPYKGIIPIAPTVFHENGDLDHKGNRRVMDLMVDQGVDGICILANFSEQFLLTDAERDEVMRLSIEQVAGRVPVCVTTSHFSTRIAAQRAKAAADAGAKMLMMMPPYHGALLKADEQGHDRALQDRRRRLWHPDHPAGCAALRRDHDRAVHGASQQAGAAGPLLQDRGAGHSGQACVR